MTLFKIDFRVLSQNLSKIGPAGAVLGVGPCKVGVPGLGGTFSAGIVRFSCFFRLPMWILCGKYTSIVVNKSYSSDCMCCRAAAVSYSLTRELNSRDVRNVKYLHEK